MPPAKTSSRRRLLANENDENSASTRITRAKGAIQVHEEGIKRSKSSVSTKSALAPSRRRPALGDVSNTTKLNHAAAATAAQVQKVTATKLVAAATAAATLNGVTTAAASTTIAIAATTASTSTKSSSVVPPPRKASLKRPILASNKPTTKPTDLKRSATDVGENDNASRKRHRSSDAADVADAHIVASDENVKPVYVSVPGRKQDQPQKQPEKLRDIKPERQSSIISTTASTVKTEEAPKRQESAKAGFIPFAYACPEVEYVFPPGVHDLDSDDLDDPLMTAEYVHEIFAYLKELEVQTMPNHDYMKVQHELEWQMRGILVDWIIEVHQKFRLLPETLFLAVNIIDRFLTCKVVLLDRLQLVGITALFLASKYEEVLAPHVSNFKHVADDAFSEEEILSAEVYLLKTLEWNISQYPNPMNFLRRISKADQYDVPTRTIGKYLLEISCLDHRLMQFVPSQLAAGAMYLARLVADRGEWDPTIAFYAGYTEKEVMPCVRYMVDYIYGPIKHDAFFKKYAAKKFNKTSIVVRNWVKLNYIAFVSEFGRLS